MLAPWGFLVQKREVVFVLKIQDWSTRIKVAAQKPLCRHTDDDKLIITYNGHKEVFGCINIPAKIAFN